MASDEQVADAIAKAAAGATGLTPCFLLPEWRHMVDVWQIADMAAYAKVPRLGRKNRMSAGQRERLWPVFAAVRTSLAKRGPATWPEVYGRTAAHYAGRPEKPFTRIVVTRRRTWAWRSCASSPRSPSPGPDAPFFAGDLGPAPARPSSRPGCHG